MTPRLALLLPGDPDTPTGGYLYDRRIVAELRAHGWEVAVIALDASFPAPTAAALAHAGGVLAALPDDSLVLVDGLAFGAMPELAAVHRARLRLVALVHHPLAHETGLDPARARALHAAEAAALAAARAVIVTSPETAARVAAEFGVDPQRLEVVEPGTDGPDRPPAPRPAASDPLQLLCVATVVPRKGHELLLRALACLECEPRPRLDCIGSTTRDPAQAARIDALVAELGLGTSVRMRGECPPATVAAAFAAADVFVLPAWYEGYGMAVAEAVAHGLPVVATAVGAAPRLLGDDAGLLVPPGDLPALAAALRRVVEEPGLRERLAAGARRRAASLPRWPTQAARLARRLATVAAA